MFSVTCMNFHVVCKSAKLSELLIALRTLKWLATAGNFHDGWPGHFHFCDSLAIFLNEISDHSSVVLMN